MTEAEAEEAVPVSAQDHQTAAPDDSGSATEEDDPVLPGDDPTDFGGAGNWCLMDAIQ